MKKLRTDIAIDELSENNYGIILMDEAGETIATVYGKTPEEAIERADSLFCRQELIDTLKDFNSTILSTVLENEERSIITTSTLNKWVEENIR